jgi:hypothetical protein
MEFGRRETRKTIVIFGENNGKCENSTSGALGIVIILPIRFG